MFTGAGAKMGVEAAQRLAALGCCEIEDGLTDAEFARIERKFGFEFAEDHRAFLAVGLPVSSAPEDGATWSNPWPDWRGGDPEALRMHVNWELDFLIERVEDGEWDPRWGSRPSTRDMASREARRVLLAAPKMVPVYGHRFLPAGRGSYGHPVLSMWGWDIIVYGADLLDYIGNEFDRTYDDRQQAEVTVPFWRDYLPTQA
ncbi:hypothetical protein ACIBSS_33285 [Micromonospora aurantiaca]|uniref:hypothetical protein n=1 Tax=Micromonospora aurantiaca (nom. illeg.) TaxID=47850 RepID=UPI0017FA9F48|nr:hypothetical protein [Micromonospora aurantiaca]